MLPLMLELTFKRPFFIIVSSEREEEDYKSVTSTYCAMYSFLDFESFHL